MIKFAIAFLFAALAIAPMLIAHAEWRDADPEPEPQM